MIYSPSLTELWKFCPLKAHLQRIEMLEPVVNRNLLARLAGTAIAEAVTVLHREWQRTGADVVPAPYIIAAAKERGTKYLSLSATHYQVCGVQVEQGTVDNKLLEIQRVIERYAKAMPLAGYTIVDVERELPQYGRCRIDLGVITPGKDYAIADVKYKANLDAKYRESTINEYLDSWQFEHYAWAYEETIGKPVPLKYLLMITMRPSFAIDLIPREVDREWQKVWKQSAEVTWKDMTEERQGTRPMGISAVHKSNFGPCEMRGVCFDYKLDVDRATEKDYVRVPQFDFELALTRDADQPSQ